MRATTRDASQLMHEGAIALSRVEHNGIKIDLDYLNSAIETVSGSIKDLERGLRSDDIFAAWRRRFGEKTKLGSREQLGEVLFNVLGLAAGEYTGKSTEKKRRYKTDEEALEVVDHPFVRNFLECEKLKKLKSTYLENVKREARDGFLRAFYNLHIPISFRSSSSDPNFQNIPIRDAVIGKIIRQAFIPRKGRMFLEVDFKGAEVCNSCCYSKDANLIAYVTDPTRDMHRDVAGQIFKLKTKEISKQTRQSIKGNFVFAEFYGAWYKTCAPKIWQDIERFKLTTADGKCLYERLREIGITELGACSRGSREDPQPGTFEHHIWKIERDFWDRRFVTYRDWKNAWWEKYQTRGYFDMLSGFRCAGVFGKKEVCNYPIQGASFHCLLWSLIQLDKWLMKNKMRTLIIGQIHDSMILDAVKSELAAVREKITEIITVDLPRHWSWLIVPLTVEMEGSYENWYAKKPLEIAV